MAEDCTQEPDNIHNAGSPINWSAIPHPSKHHIWPQLTAIWDMILWASWFPLSDVAKTFKQISCIAMSVLPLESFWPWFDSLSCFCQCLRPCFGAFWTHVSEQCFPCLKGSRDTADQGQTWYTDQDIPWLGHKQRFFSLTFASDLTISQILYTFRRWMTFQVCTIFNRRLDWISLMLVFIL